MNNRGTNRSTNTAVVKRRTKNSAWLRAHGIPLVVWLRASWSERRALARRARSGPPLISSMRENWQGGP